MIRLPDELPTGSERAEIASDIGTYVVVQRGDGDWDIVGKQSGLSYAAVLGFDAGAVLLRVVKPLAVGSVDSEGNWRALLRLGL